MEYYLDSDGNFQDHFINQFDSKRDDILYGRDYTDYMFGGAGKDELYGKGGNDQLIGGPGDDLLEGGLGNDLYFFKKGDGNDVIVESDEGETFGVDVIRITGFALDEIKVNFNRKDVFGPTKVKVTISFTSSSDTLTFVHSYGKGNNIEYIHFCDEYQNTIKIINFKKLADYFTMKNKLTNDDDYFSLTYLLEFATKNGQAFEVNDKEAYEASDPIVMDLDGDGLETVGIEKRVFFDHDGDGKSSLTGWVGPDDGLLVRDLNGDGVINNGTELFGEYALMKDGSRSQNGYAALSELDDNGDGSIDKNDAGFAQLKVWKDSNSDGKSTPNELFTLPDLGIAAIHTKYYDIGSGNESNDNILIRESDYIKQDGSSWAMGEYFFELATNRIDPEQFKQIMKRQEEPVFEKKEPPIIHSNQYEVILANQYIITDMVEKITLEESLDEIAYRATIDLVITDDFPAIGPGQEIRISGIAPQGTSLVYLFHPGVIWECSSRNSGQKHLTVTAYDKTIYLNKCEDEYLLPAGQTASQRLKRYAADWKIPLGHVAETGKSLAKGVYRSQTIFSMILNDLKDTVSRDGLMYRARMTPNGLELYEIGSNSPVWMLDMDQNVEEITQKRTLEGAVTQVKVLGKAKEEDKPVPVLAVEKGETEKYGTLQRIIQNSNIETASQAKKAAQKLLTGMQETITVTAIDINTIRAGDKVQIKDLAFIVTSVRHELGMPGSMTLELMHIDAVRRKYFMAD
ncbi:calcium-binding protein [Paenibacillus elgii]|uniref:calcium-binding protein n=1 Tax=Paenibacillus elgii TaxID=189691 RepID=UPI0030DBB693